MYNNDYTKKLESIIKQMLQPLKGIPLKLVIEGLYNHTIIPFDFNDTRDRKLLEDLIVVADRSAKNINKKGILRKRANEVGNDIEKYVKESLEAIGYKCNTPITSEGKMKSTGYPDIEFIDRFNRTNYLECKTFNSESLNSSLRSFYLSPSRTSKITKDAHHFAISMEIYQSGSKNGLSIFKCKVWKILCLEKLEVDVKYEFQSDNIHLYKKEMILAERNIKSRL
jgi:hypothetical protein